MPLPESPGGWRTSIGPTPWTKCAGSSARVRHASDECSPSSVDQEARMSSAYTVYLELSEQGECMAHVPTLPGCVVRAADQATALTALPDAIRAYHAWLRRHGEDAPDPPEPIRLTVAETQPGMTLFRHRGRAALFDPDHVPLTRAELDRTLQVAGYTRADLLALVRSLPAAILDWKATPEAMSIREILR